MNLYLEWVARIMLDPASTLAQRRYKAGWLLGALALKRSEEHNTKSI